MLPGKMAKRDYSVLVWNLENFTNRPRPNHRAITPKRLDALWDTLRRDGLDIVVLLETGDDGGDIVQGIVQRDAQRALASGWWGRVSPITGPDDPLGLHNDQPYGGETYTVLFRGKKIKQGSATLTLIGPTTSGGRECRQACLISVDGIPLLTALHAPSPSHDLTERLAVIRQCAELAKRRYNAGRLKAGVLCGDLNIKSKEFESLEEELEGVGYGFAGPADEDSAPLFTSVRKKLDKIFNESVDSESYDQVWRFQGTDLLDVSRVAVHVPNVSLEDEKEFIFRKKIMEKSEDKKPELRRSSRTIVPRKKDTVSKTKLKNLSKRMGSALKFTEEVKSFIPSARRSVGDDNVNKRMMEESAQTAVLLKRKREELDTLIEDDDTLYEAEFDELNRDVDTLTDKIKLTGNAYMQMMTQGEDIQGALLRDRVSDHKGVTFRLTFEV
jgi:hypothetical protein